MCSLNKYLYQGCISFDDPRPRTWILVVWFGFAFAISFVILQTFCHVFQNRSILEKIIGHLLGINIHSGKIQDITIFNRSYCSIAVWKLVNIFNKCYFRVLFCVLTSIIIISSETRNICCGSSYRVMLKLNEEIPVKR